MIRFDPQNCCRVPVMATNYKFDSRIRGRTPDRTLIVLPIYAAVPLTLAHELGHFAGWGNPDDRDSHSDDPGNIMYRYTLPGAMPDGEYCEKVNHLAH